MHLPHDLAASEAAEWCAALPGGTAVGTDGTPVDVSAACRVLRRWDRSVDSDSRGALLFDRFWRKASSAPAAELWRTPFDPADPVRTPRGLNTAAPVLGRALADAVAELRAAGIALDARLGDHQFVVRNGKRLPIGGGTESLGIWNKTEPKWNAARSRRLYGGVVGLQLHPGGRLGRQPLPGGPDAADVLPVGEPEVTALQRPDPAVRG